MVTGRRPESGSGARAVAAFVALIVALVLAAAAGGETIELGWKEKRSAYGRHLIMRFEVRRLTIERGGWTASVSIDNDTNVRLAVRRDFALLAFAGPSDRVGGVAFHASRFRPQLPSVLNFEQVWTGEMGGRGVPPRGRYLRLRFAHFSMVIAPNLNVRHVTRHAYLR